MTTGTPRIALETTLLLHGVPREAAMPLAAALRGIVRENGAEAALVGVIRGEPTVGVSDEQLQGMLDEVAAAGADGVGVPKLNTSNIGVAMHRGLTGATTVSTTMEIAAARGVMTFATGGLGGVHKGYGVTLDISADLAAFTRFPVAVVTAGVKSILDVAATREALEALGVPVIGFRTDWFPAFYLRKTDPLIAVDARFDDAAELGRFARREIHRTGRGMVIVNPIPEGQEIAPAQWDQWLSTSMKRALAAGVMGRAVTPFVLKTLHEVSEGVTLRANVDLVKSNAAVAAQVARAMLAERAG
ncbi:MAG: pseudouridine-5'-phosphate glycosidase [Phycisphaeraceae bacterium]|nr:pseudouridine-5'-phosphate glycosidase [Phycisphaeraceae bacterium]